MFQQSSNHLQVQEKIFNFSTFLVDGGITYFLRECFILNCKAFDFKFLSRSLETGLVVEPGHEQHTNQPTNHQQKIKQTTNLGLRPQSLFSSTSVMSELELSVQCQNWNYHILIKIEQKLGLYFSKLLKALMLFIATQCIVFLR